MYPRVKVRQHEDPIAIQEEETSLVETGSECKNDSQPAHARTLKTRRKKLAQPVVAPKGKNSKGFDEDSKAAVRASSVPRPRAVLSSPDNDEIIGNQNQRSRGSATPIRRQTSVSDVISGQHNGPTVEKRSLPRKQNSSSNIQAQCKQSCSTIRLGSPLSTRKVIEEAGNKSIEKEKHFSELSTSRQKPPFK